jgi:c(7)-type cytochrome triheme protein
MRRRSWLVAFALLVAQAPSLASADGGTRKRRPLPYEYGRVVIDNGSTAAKLPAVVFEHWVHRGRFTCRLCHVDLGFGMTAGSTRITAADNAAGYYCGACHDRKRTFEGGKTLFESCARLQPGVPVRDTCYRCHSLGKDVKQPRVDFAAVTGKLPPGRFGNGVDWEKAEEQGLVKPVDFLEGVSIKRQPLTAQKDFALTPNLQGMPEIIFSHAKHTTWNGCELCHPEIFVGVKKGTTKYSMQEIFAGKYCGVCHVNVAFPLADCQRCHSKPVR